MFFDKVNAQNSSLEDRLNHIKNKDYSWESIPNGQGPTLSQTVPSFYQTNQDTTTNHTGKKDSFEDVKLTLFTRAPNGTLAEQTVVGTSKTPGNVSFEFPTESRHPMETIDTSSR